MRYWQKFLHTYKPTLDLSFGVTCIHCACSIFIIIITSEVSLWPTIDRSLYLVNSTTDQNHNLHILIYSIPHLPIDEVFMVLIRLRLGLLENDLVHRFSITSVSRILATWIIFLSVFSLSGRPTVGFTTSNDLAAFGLHFDGYGAFH